MPEKDTSQSAAEALIDLRSLELEIDKEIDALLVPAIQKAQRAAEGSQTAREAQDSPQPGTDRENRESTVTRSFSLDFNDLQVEIEKEIDNLLVPAVEYRDQAPVKAGNKKRQHKMQSKFTAADDKESGPARTKAGPSPQSSQTAASTKKLDDLQIEIEKEIDNLLVPAAEYRNQAPVQAGNEELSPTVQSKFAAADDKESGPARKKAGPSPQSSQAAASTKKLDDLQIEIEKEIDNLLVPAAEYRNQAPVQAGNEELSPTVQATFTAADQKESVPARKKAGPSPQSSQTAASTKKLDDLQIEIEKEIDNLLVPAAEYRNHAPVQAGNEELSPTVQARFTAADEKESVPALEKAGPSPQPSQAAASSEKLDDLQIEIEKEIDNLLIPAAEYRKYAPVQAGNEELSPSVQATFTAADEKESVPALEKAGPSPQPSQAAASSEEPDNAPAATRFDSRELAGLIERFNAAYLSFDWELSKENIGKFLTVLNELEPFAARSADTKSVLRLMEVILKRLLDRPHAVNSILVQLIRDSQGLLAHMLLSDGETGPHEKQQLKELFALFNDLRQRALAAKAGTKRQKLEDSRPKAAAPASVGEIQPPRETSPALLSSATETSSIEELRDWMDTIWRTLSENIKVFDTEISRFRQIETTLGKTADLVPIARRLNGIGNALESQVDILRDKRGEFIDWASRVARLETAPGHAQTKAPGAEPAAAAGATCEKAGARVYNESLYLIASNGKCLALPAACVLKVARSSIKRAGKILKRGYATLDDFSPPLLRWIISGVLGEWTKRPRKELNSYRFEPVEPGLFDRSETCGQVAVLASDGNKHSVIFADSADLIADPQMAVGASNKGDPGASETLQSLFPLAFDPASPLSLPDQISSTTSATERCRR